MSTRIATAPWIPGYRWWAMLAAVLAAGLIGNWAIAAGLLVLLLAQVARPFDFVTSFLVVVTGASFVFNEGGGMTSQIGLLMFAVVPMLACYVFSMRGRALSLSRATLTGPLLAFVLLSIANAVRGLQAGSPARNVGLELIAILALGTALLVSNAFEARRDLRLALVGLIVIGFGPAIWGFYVFSIVHTHSIGFYSMAIPGMVGLMLVNLALRSKTLTATLGWIAVSVPLFIHQFITFGRGLWTGCAAGLVVSAAIFAGFGQGSAARWGRVALVVAILAGVGLAGAIQAAVVFQQTDLLTEAWTRLTSITTVDTGLETRSNVIRLWESGRVLGLIRGSPMLGHGVGFTFSVKDPFSNLVVPQWGVHQNFLLVWLKQGLVGLALFLWMLWAAIAMGVREARRRTDPWESTWFATTAAATVFLVVFSLSNFPFARVNEMFFLAMLWGGAVAMTRKGLVLFQWSPPAPAERGEAA